jgi:peptidoglycan-associated lipoprotein
MKMKNGEWGMGNSGRGLRLVLSGLVLLLVIAGAAGCKKKTPPTGQVPPPPTARPGQALPTVTLRATPSSIERGQSTTLEWSSQNATTLTLEPGLGQVPMQGTMTLSPFDSITYRLIAQGPGGKAEATARITVSARPVAAEPPPATSVDISREFESKVRDIYFDYDSFNIRSDAVPVLQANADFLRARPQANIVIEGHCDERGSAEYNLGLGDRRANSVKEYLVSLGIDGNRIRTISYGKERPQCSEQTEDCWQRNRRGHFVLAR